MVEDKKANIKYINVDALAQLLGLCRATIFKLSKSKDFPKSRIIGSKRVVRWEKTEVIDWIEKQKRC